MYKIDNDRTRGEYVLIGEYLMGEWQVVRGKRELSAILLKRWEKLFLSFSPPRSSPMASIHFSRCDEKIYGTRCAHRLARIDNYCCTSSGT